MDILLAPPHALLLSMVLPLLAVFGIIALARRPNLRETVSLGTSVIVIGLVFHLYNQFKSGVSVELSLFEILSGFALAFKLEALGMLFALVATSLWLVTIIYEIGRAHV